MSDNHPETVGSVTWICNKLKIEYLDRLRKIVRSKDREQLKKILKTFQ